MKPGSASISTLDVLKLTMHARKVGLEVAPGRFHAGEVEVVVSKLVLHNKSKPIPFQIERVP